MKKIILALIIIAGVLAILRFSGGEDAWICQDGQWVKHGNPGSPMPASGCGSGQNQDTNGQSTPDKKENRAVKLYYYSPTQDTDADGNILCSRQGLVAVNRKIPITQTPIQDTIKLFLKGELTQEEKSFGITSEYPLSGLELKGASLKNGQLTLELLDPLGRTGGGSCRVAILWAQIEATARQFPEVSSVRFIPDTFFQP